MLDTTVTTRVPPDSRKAARTPARDQPGTQGTSPLRRDLGEDFAPRRRYGAPVSNVMYSEDEVFLSRPALGGVRLRLRGGIPRSILGRCLAGVAIFLALGASLVGMWWVRSLLLSNPRLVLASSSAIQITGNSHLSRAQLLTVFGEDVDRNILTVPLAQRRAELEHLPWVDHATVMRLLPNRFRVAISERKPVAFVRQGSAIGLVDANGVLLDMAADPDSENGATPPQPHFSFPVVTGISAQDPLSVRAARMKLFTRFTTELGEQTANISEVDLSNPEDVKALLPDDTSDILVHFGEDNFLRRYDLYRKNLPGWRKDFPRLASADMRYERQVVLEMKPGGSVSAGDAANPSSPAPAEPLKAAAKAPVKLKAKPSPKKPGAPSQSASSIAVKPQHHLQTSFDVPHKSAPAKAKSTQAGTQ